MQSSVLGQHHHHVPLPPPTSDDNCTTVSQLKVGCVYEIEHAYLPRRTPAQLRSIRVAMVCEKTELNVSIRYPSMQSLKTFFSNSARETHPALDEKFVMGIKLADKVLIQIVPAVIFFEGNRLQDFWLLSSASLMGNTCLLSELKGNGMVRWGIRRRVKYVEKHRESVNGVANVYVQKSSSSFINGGGDDEAHVEKLETEDEKNDENGVEDEDVGNDENGVEGENLENDENGVEDEDEKVKEDIEDDDDDNKEEESEEENEEKIEVHENLKRKRYTFRNISKKKPKRENQKQKKKNKTTKKSRTRLSELIVLKNPKTRWSSERYKHSEKSLLEVMNEKKATAQKPILRLQLRAEARKKIGDTGLLDHLLKHMAGKLAPGGEQRFRRRHNADGAMEYWLESADLVNVRKEAGVNDPYWVPPPGWKPGDSTTQDPVCAKELKLLKDHIENIKRDMDLKATKKQLEEEIGRFQREMDELNSQLSPKIRHEENHAIAITLEKYNEQLMFISDFVKQIEGDIGKLICKVDLTFMAPDKEKKQERAEEPKIKQQEVQAFNAAASGEQTEKTEQNALKLQRLKSGFTLCKPHGSFLWPGRMNNKNDTVLVQVNEIPTPPSVSSSTALAPPPPMFPYTDRHHHRHPLKPLAERGGLTVTVSTTNTATTMVNLNDAPITPTNIPLLPKKRMCYDQKENNSAICAAPKFPSQVGNWLALSDLKSGSDEATHV